ncbi:DUF2855 family protein [Streptomyces malaysiensis]|uniref:DUF2855 family protein n=1 Tax=Streptomyces malaysiensis subsp. samsunensis TaxID=459658 RepID=A0A9X2LT53_STRMQ|nr:DUF2855 family protein [Streptomyces samsunensis]MCQ8829043.1 DUF2855 family protein [Streptomyces samsunensis]
MASSTAWDLLVRRDNLTAFECVPADPAPLEPGTARLAVERIALTANNVTYAHLGERAGYWTAFPAPEGFGRIPAWGFGVVEETAHPEVSVGERFYGYFPLSTHLTVHPAPSATGFTDTAPHRRRLHDFYSDYRRVGPYEPSDDLRTALRPAYRSSLLLAGSVTAATDRRPLSVVVSSASSKTALGLAERLGAESDVVTYGLTSPANRAFVDATGCYDEVRPYTAVAELDPAGPAVFADLTRNQDVVSAVHHRLAGRLIRSILVGGTHASRPLDPAGLPGPAPERFFAPSAEEEARRAVGAGGAEARRREYQAAEERFTERAADWFRVTTRTGPDAMADAFRQLIQGPGDPAAVRVVRPAAAS